MQTFSRFVLLFMASTAFATSSSDTAVSYSSCIIFHLNVYDRHAPLLHKQSHSFVPTALAPQIISIPPMPKKYITLFITWGIVKKARQVVSSQPNIRTLSLCTVHIALALGITSTPPTRPRWIMQSENWDTVPREFLAICILIKFAIPSRSTARTVEEALIIFILQTLMNGKMQWTT